MNRFEIEIHLISRTLKFTVACFLFLFTSIIRTTAQTQAVKPKEIILLIGQSNMAGRAALEARDTEIVDNVFLLDSTDRWIPLKNPLNLHSSIRKVKGMQRYNLGYNFSKALSEDGNFSNTGLVVNAKGGTNINQWVPGTHFYQEAVRRGTIAAGTNGKVIATFWLQGESNLGDDDPEFKIYFENLKSIVLGLRAEFENEQMIFIAAELGKERPENDIFKKMLSRLEDEIPHAATVKAKNTSTYDGTHFDHQSLDTLGLRFYKKFKECFQKLP